MSSELPSGMTLLANRNGFSRQHATDLTSTSEPAIFLDNAAKTGNEKIIGANSSATVKQRVMSPKLPASTEESFESSRKHQAMRKSSQLTSNRNNNQHNQQQMATDGSVTVLQLVVAKSPVLDSKKRQATAHTINTVRSIAAESEGKKEPSARNEIKTEEIKREKSASQVVEDGAVSNILKEGESVVVNDLKSKSKFNSVMHIYDDDEKATSEIFLFKLKFNIVKLCLIFSYWNLYGANQRRFI